MKGFKIKGINKTTIKTAAKTAGKTIEKNAPAICAGIAIAAMVSAVVTAIKYAPICKQELEDAITEADAKKNEKALRERMESGDESTPIVNLNFKEKLPIYIRVCGKRYWKTFVAMIIAIVCVTASVHLGNKETKKYAILAAAAETSLSESLRTTESIVGEKKFNEIKNKILDDKVESSVPQGEGDIIETGHGTVLCFDKWYGLWFRSDPTLIHRAYASMVKDIVNVYDISAHEWFADYLHIPENRIPKKAEREGWHIDPENGIKYLPELPEELPFKGYTVDGRETPVCIVDINEPKSIDRLVWEKLPAHERDQMIFRV